jgi:NADH dehydrogenase
MVQEPGAVAHLRSLGAKVAVDAITDPDTLRAVLDEAHTVCHLSGDLFLSGDESYEEAILESTRSVLRAAKKAKVRRFLLVSYPGASARSANEFLRHKGLAEEAVRESGLEHMVLRCTHIYGPGSRWLAFMVAAANRRPVVVVGTGSQRLAPVFCGDVARALAAADDRAMPIKGAYGLEGPEVLTADEFIDLLAGRKTRKRHIGPEAHPPDQLGLALSGPALEVLAADSLADAGGAPEEFGLERTPLAAGLAASGLKRIASAI